MLSIVARFGNVIYWLGCSLAAVLLLGAIGAAVAPSLRAPAASNVVLGPSSVVPMTMPSKEVTDPALLAQLNAPAHKGMFDDLIPLRPPRELYILAGSLCAAAFLIWLIGRAIRYVLAGR